jgi:hypothetical protein
MTHHQHDHPSVQDMTFVLAEGRMADLRASAAPLDPMGNAPRADAPAGFVARTRDAVGRRLIALGGSVVADEALRQRALHR